MKGYKAFQKGLICNPTGKKPFQYKENTIFEQKRDAKICKRGFHFCKKPLDVLNYYDLIDNKGNITEFAEVEALEEPVTDDNIKFVTKKIRIGNKINLEDLLNEDIRITLQEKDESDLVSISAQHFSEIKADRILSRIISTGNRAIIEIKGRSAKIISKGMYSYIVSFAPDTIIFSSGEKAKIISNIGATNIFSTGKSAIISSIGAITQIISSGDNAQIFSCGDYTRIKSTGNSSVITCSGKNSIVSAKKGSWISFAEPNTNYSRFLRKKTEQVDGEKIKEDTFYRFVNGKFEEV